MATGGDGQRPGDDPALLRRLFDANPDGLWLFGDDGVTTWANAHMARILGRDARRARRARRCTTSSTSRAAATSTPTSPGWSPAGTGAENIDAYFIRPDGTAVWGLISYAPVHDDDGARIGWLHRVTPYTERKELLEALVEREQQLATAQQIAHIGSWEWDVADRPGAVVRRDVPDLRRRARH